jgi:hypothetical protein
MSDPVSYFTFRGQRYELLSLEKLTFDEARELKRISGGMAPRQVMAALADLDPDATVAMLVVSMRRTRALAAEGEFASENLLDILASFEHVGAEEEEPQNPPDLAPRRTKSADGAKPVHPEDETADERDSA